MEKPKSLVNFFWGSEIGLCSVGAGAGLGGAKGQALGPGLGPKGAQVPGPRAQKVGPGPRGRKGQAQWTKKHAALTEAGLIGIQFFLIFYTVF